ncbi:MAG: dihydroorotate dehydrogenase [Candidatus Altiarchaeales archaeon]|nr:dihydroorotate dehydrogenase [Candidatus Altiarchaeales archaeon]
MDLSTSLCGVKVENPVLLASGILGTTKGALKLAAENGAGAVVIKSISLKPRMGHENPILTETESGFLNAVGYSNMGLKEALEEFKDNQDVPAPVIASIIGETPEEFAELAQQIQEADFKAIELPLSCPHTPGTGLMAGHGTPKATRIITAEVKKNCDLPVIVKLSPSVMQIGELAQAAKKAGADAITVGNSLGPGMQIDIYSKKPTLGFGVGGLSGPAIKPITIRCIWDAYKAVEGGIPVIGCGGLTTGEDAVEAMLAGASQVEIGTAIHYRGLNVFEKIKEEIKKYMKDRQVEKIGELVGAAHGR